jgi:hypothetical protein
MPLTAVAQPQGSYSYTYVRTSVLRPVAWTKPNCGIGQRSPISGWPNSRAESADVEPADLVSEECAFDHGQI